MRTHLRVVYEDLGEVHDVPALDGGDLIFGEPADLLSIFPNAVLLLGPLLGNENSEAVLLTLIPPARVLLLI